MAPDGGILVAGGTDGDLDGHTNAGGSDIFIMKLDASGSPAELVGGHQACENDVKSRREVLVLRFCKGGMF